MLELALIQYAMQFAASKGFLPITTPDIVRSFVLEGFFLSFFPFLQPLVF